MGIFRAQNIKEFGDYFKSDDNCKEYLAYVKWENGYQCVNCSNKTSQIRKDFSRTCNKCSHTETASAHTLFHNIRFGLRKAFFICFELSITNKKLFGNYMGVRYGVTEKTALLFMNKVRKAMKLYEQHSIDKTIQFGELCLGIKKK